VGAQGPAAGSTVLSLAPLNTILASCVLAPRYDPVTLVRKSQVTIPASGEMNQLLAVTNGTGSLARAPADGNAMTSVKPVPSVLNTSVDM
jgi:hypothetical protein